MSLNIHSGRSLPSPPSAQISFDFLFYFGGPMEDGPHPGLYPLTQPVTSPPPDLFINFICIKLYLYLTFY